MSEHIFNIAGWKVVMTFACPDADTDIHLLPSLFPFRATPSDDAPLLFTLHVDNSLHPMPKERRQRIRAFDTGNGNTVVDRIDDGGYQFIIRDIFNNDCALLVANASFSECHVALNGNQSMRSFGLNSALMMAFSFAGSAHSTLLIHASVVRNNGYAYAFTAKSGTGKSTQSANWMRTIPGTDLMNDDNPVIRVIDGHAILYGSPWSGKTPCYRNIKAPLAAITQIDRHHENHVERMAPLRAFALILPACSSMKWEHEIYTNICDTLSAVIKSTPVYTLHCTAEPESAIVCHAAISRSDAPSASDLQSGISTQKNTVLDSSSQQQPHGSVHRPASPLKRMLYKILPLAPVPVPKAPSQSLSIPNEVLMPEVARLVSKGHTVTLPLKGNSMRPFLCHSRDKGILRSADTIKVGDPVLAEVRPKHYVLHRIVAIDGDDITLRGDGNIATEHCHRDDVIALAFAFLRKGRTTPDYITGRKWRVYSFFWMRLLPFRGFLLTLHHIMFRSLKVLD